MQECFFFQTNKKLLIHLMWSKTWCFFSVWRFVKLTLPVLLSYSCSWATVHDQNRSPVQGNFHTLGHWLWPDWKNTAFWHDELSFWRNRQDCCFSPSSIFISRSFLANQCWWLYTKCLQFQGNCHRPCQRGTACECRRQFSGSSNFLYYFVYSACGLVSTSFQYDFANSPG